MPKISSNTATAATQATTLALMHFRPHLRFRLEETPELREFLSDEKSELLVWQKYLKLCEFFRFASPNFSQSSKNFPTQIDFPPPNLFLIKATETLALQ